MENDEGQEQSKEQNVQNTEQDSQDNRTTAETRSDQQLHVVTDNPEQATLLDAAQSLLTLASTPVSPVLSMANTRLSEGVSQYSTAAQGNWPNVLLSPTSSSSDSRTSTTFRSSDSKTRTPTRSKLPLRVSTPSSGSSTPPPASKRCNTPGTSSRQESLTDSDTSTSRRTSTPSRLPRPIATDSQGSSRTTSLREALLSIPTPASMSPLHLFRPRSSPVVRSNIPRRSPDMSRSAKGKTRSFKNSTSTEQGLRKPIARGTWSRIPTVKKDLLARCKGNRPPLQRMNAVDSPSDSHIARQRETQDQSCHTSSLNRVRSKDIQFPVAAVSSPTYLLHQTGEPKVARRSSPKKQKLVRQYSEENLATVSTMNMSRDDDVEETQAENRAGSDDNIVNEPHAENVPSANTVDEPQAVKVAADNVGDEPDGCSSTAGLPTSSTSYEHHEPVAVQSESAPEPDADSESSESSSSSSTSSSPDSDQAEDSDEDPEVESLYQDIASLVTMGDDDNEDFNPEQQKTYVSPKKENSEKTETESRSDDGVFKIPSGLPPRKRSKLRRKTSPKKRSDAWSWQQPGPSDHQSRYRDRQMSHSPSKTRKYSGESSRFSTSSVSDLYPEIHYTVESLDAVINTESVEIMTFPGTSMGTSQTDVQHISGIRQRSGAQTEQDSEDYNFDDYDDVFYDSDDDDTSARELKDAAESLSSQSFGARSLLPSLSDPSTSQEVVPSELRISVTGPDDNLNDVSDIARIMTLGPGLVQGRSADTDGQSDTAQSDTLLASPRRKRHVTTRETPETSLTPEPESPQVNPESSWITIRLQPFQSHVEDHDIPPHSPYKRRRHESSLTLPSLASPTSSDADAFDEPDAEAVNFSTSPDSELRWGRTSAGPSHKIVPSETEQTLQEGQTQETIGSVPEVAEEVVVISGGENVLSLKHPNLPSKDTTADSQRATEQRKRPKPDLTLTVPRGVLIREMTDVYPRGLIDHTRLGNPPGSEGTQSDSRYPAHSGSGLSTGTSTSQSGTFPQSPQSDRSTAPRIVAHLSLTTGETLPSEEFQTNAGEGTSQTEQSLHALPVNPEGSSVPADSAMASGQSDQSSAVAMSEPAAGEVESPVLSTSPVSPPLTTATETVTSQTTATTTEAAIECVPQTAAGTETPAQSQVSSEGQGSSVIVQFNFAEVTPKIYEKPLVPTVRDLLGLPKEKPASRIDALPQLSEEDGMADTVFVDKERPEQLESLTPLIRETLALKDLWFIQDRIIIGVHSSLVSSVCSSQYWGSLTSHPGFSPIGTAYTDFPRKFYFTISQDALLVIVHYIYSGKLRLNLTIAKEVLLIATHAGIKYIEERCTEYFLQFLSVHTTCYMLDLAFQTFSNVLMSYATEFFNHHIEEIIANGTLLNLDPFSLASLLSLDTLVLRENKVVLNTAQREDTVLRAVLTYFRLCPIIEPFAAWALVESIRPSLLPPSPTLPEKVKSFDSIQDNIYIKELLLAFELGCFHPAVRIPASWYRWRTLTVSSFIHRDRFVHANRSSGRMPMGYDFEDSSFQISRIDLWERLEGSRVVIAALIVTYRLGDQGTEVISDSLTNLSDLSEYTHRQVVLQPGENISKVMLNSSDTHIHKIGFKTNRNNIFGPFGDTCRFQYVEETPQTTEVASNPSRQRERAALDRPDDVVALKSCLYSLCVDHYKDADGLSVCNLTVKWICLE